MSGLLSPDTGYFRLFSLFSFWRASARLHLKKKKLLENFSVAGACSFHGADFCHNDKEAAVNTRRIYKAFAKVRAKIRPSKPMRVRISSAMDSIHPFWTFFPIPKGAVKKTCVFLQPLVFIKQILICRRIRQNVLNRIGHPSENFGVETFSFQLFFPIKHPYYRSLNTFR